MISPSANSAPATWRGLYALPRRRITDRTCLAVWFSSTFVLWLIGSITSAGLNDFFNKLPSAPILGFVAIAVAISRVSSRPIFGQADLLLLSTLALLNAYPRTVLLWPSLTVVGVLLLRKGDKALASVGQLSLGLAWVGLWGILALRLIEPWLLPAETWLGFLPLSLSKGFSLSGNVIFGVAGNGLIVYQGCSAFANTVKTAFIWLCLLEICALSYHRWQVYGVLLSLFAVIAINCARIALMAYSHEGYLFWHTGGGAAIISVSMLMTTLTIFYFFQKKYQR